MTDTNTLVDQSKYETDVSLVAQDLYHYVCDIVLCAADDVGTLSTYAQIWGACGHDTIAQYGVYKCKDCGLKLGYGDKPAECRCEWGHDDMDRKPTLSDVRACFAHWKEKADEVGIELPNLRIVTWKHAVDTALQIRECADLHGRTHGYDASTSLTWAAYECSHGEMCDGHRVSEEKKDAAHLAHLEACGGEAMCLTRGVA